MMKLLYWKTPSQAIVWPLLLSATLLASCASVERVIRPSVIIPNSLLVCEDYPPIPGEGATDTDLAVFMLRGEFAWRDCRDNLKSVADLLASQD